MTIRERIAQKTIHSILSFSCLVSLSSAETASAKFLFLMSASDPAEAESHEDTSRGSAVQLAEDPELIEVDPGGLSSHLDTPVEVAEDPELIEVDPGGLSIA